MAATVHRLHTDHDHTAEQALAALNRLLDRCSLKAPTVRAYRRQARDYTNWLATQTGRYPDPFTDVIGAEAAVTGWRRHLLDTGAAPPTVNQAIAAVTLMYQEGARLRLKVKRVRVEKPGAPDALTANEQEAVTRTADRRGVRDSAIVALLLGTGARVEECARLTVADIPLTARTGTVRLLGKGDQVRRVPVPADVREKVTAWLTERAELLDGKPDPGQLWIGQRGPMGVEGITKVVLAVGSAALVPGLRPHRLRHTYATRLREGGADPAQIQALMGHASIETTQRYFRASGDEVAALVDRVFNR